MKKRIITALIAISILISLNSCGCSRTYPEEPKQESVQTEDEIKLDTEKTKDQLLEITKETTPIIVKGTFSFFKIAVNFIKDMIDLIF